MPHPFIPESNMRFGFFPKAFLPHAVVAAPFAQYLALLPPLRPLLILSPTIQRLHGETLEKLFPGSLAGAFLADREPTLGLRDELAQAVSGGFDAMIAMGGGSVADLAKAVREKQEAPLLLIPTTPSTGTEATPYALLLNEETKAKVLVRGHQILPDAVVLDPMLLQSIPVERMGYFLFDILGHALEALVSRLSSPLSDACAIQAVQIVSNVIPLLSSPYAKDTLAHIQSAGFLAGVAQGMASVGMAHACAHAVGANVPHAVAVSVFLEDVIKQNSARGVSYAKLDVLDLGTFEKLGGLFRRLREKCQLPEKNIEVAGHMEEIITAAEKDFCAPTNPVRFTTEELRAIVERHVHAI